VGMELYDMHCHVDLMPSMVDFAKEAEKEGIGIFAVTTTPKAFEKEVTALISLSNIKIGLGLHPQLVSERYGELSFIEKLIGDTRYIGEIGLDFNKQFYASKNKQMDAFDCIVNWCSLQGGKVISIHSVFSDKAVLDILQRYECAKKNKCILHWFSGSQMQLRRANEMGCFVSVNSAMLNSPNGQKLIKIIPVDRMLIESDAPFVGEVNNAQQLKTVLREIEGSLVAIFGHDIIEHIRRNSRALLLF
jgi:TatD DNase family protein